MIFRNLNFTAKGIYQALRYDKNKYIGHFLNFSFIVLALIIASVVISTVLTIRNEKEDTLGSGDGAD